MSLRCRTAAFIFGRTHAGSVFSYGVIAPVFVPDEPLVATGESRVRLGEGIAIQTHEGILCSLFTRDELAAMAHEMLADLEEPT